MADKNLKENVVGISPLGGNAIEGTVTGFAEVRNTATEEVPLFYDSRVGSFISEQAIDELDDKDDSDAKRIAHQREDEFRAKIGFKRSIEQ